LTVETPAAAPAPHRPPKRIVIPAILLALVTIFVIRAIVRGTWAETEFKYPQTSADGVVRQLVQMSPEGRVQGQFVRLAIVVDRPIDAVWTVLTDYDRLHEALPHLAPMKATKEADGRIHLTGAVTSPFRDFPFDVTVEHDQTTGGRDRTVSWDNPGGAMTVNRGHWRVSELGPSKTLVVYMIDVDIHPFPRWLVRYVLLNRLRPAMYTLRAAIEQRFPAAK
jgi:uncharacterized membrane protein